MAVETELKLHIAPEQLAKLKRHALLKTHQRARPVTRRLQNIYFDTPKLDLHKSEMALRLRHSGGKWLQTLKGGGSVQTGLHRRNEWEVPVKTAALDFSAAREVEWDEYLRPPLRRKLRPVFITDFSRTSRMLDFQGAQIELCMDQGEVRTEQRSMPICELELELISGEPRQLFELALMILAIVPFELETVSKAEYGYRLLSGFIDHPVKAVVPYVAMSEILPAVLQRSIWSCLQHLQTNLHGAVAGGDAEYLHQMRVAMRRLRVVLHMTENICADQVLSGLRADVSALCVALGRIREWDVFIAGTLRQLCARTPKYGGLQILYSASERQRTDCYEALREPAQARELQRLLLRFAIWMSGEYWQQVCWRDAEKNRPAKDFATYHLDKLAKRLGVAAQHINMLDTARLHALRIVAKKLRYSAELFAGLYEMSKSGVFFAALEALQDVLGQVNDVVVAHRLLDGLMKNIALSKGHHKAVVEAVNLTKGRIDHDFVQQLELLRKTFRRFNKQETFWK